MAAIETNMLTLPANHPLPRLLEEEIKMLYGFISRLSSTKS